ncbi:MAG: TfoX/Sxy family protein [Steroidobacteraceae bacterium]
MSVSRDYLDYVLDQLRPFGSVVARRMFGGVGLYADGFFFGIIDDTVYFKVDDSNRADYEARGCRKFTVTMGKDTPKAVSMSYFAVPEDVLEDQDDLKLWARKALAVAVAAAAGKPRPTAGKKKAAKRRSPRS